METCLKGEIELKEWIGTKVLLSDDLAAFQHGGQRQGYRSFINDETDAVMTQKADRSLYREDTRTAYPHGNSNLVSFSCFED